MQKNLFTNNHFGNIANFYERPIRIIGQNYKQRRRASITGSPYNSTKLPNYIQFLIIMDTLKLKS